MTKLFFLITFLLICGISTVSSLQCFSCLDCNTIDANSPVASCGSLSSPESAATNVKTTDEDVEHKLQDKITIGEQSFNEENNKVKVVRDRREIRGADSKAASYVCYTITYKAFNSEHKARGCAIDLANLCEIVEQQADVKCSLCRTDKCNNA